MKTSELVEEWYKRAYPVPAKGRYMSISHKAHKEDLEEAFKAGYHSAIAEVLKLRTDSDVGIIIWPEDIEKLKQEE
jgi:hypothetical protein